jgi:hypothetical protein
MIGRERWWRESGGGGRKGRLACMAEEQACSHGKKGRGEDMRARGIMLVGPCVYAYGKRSVEALS